MAENTLDEPGGETAPAIDDRLRQKKRARRRLIGAIALALAAIIVLPVVMDREPAPTGPEIQVRIPSQDAAPAIAAPSVGVAPSVPSAETTAPAATPAKTESVSKPEPTVEAVPTPPAAKPIVEAKPVEKKPAESAAKPVADDTARAEAALAGEAPTTKKSGAGDNGKWVVQLGAYQGAGNVSVLLAKLKEMKVPAYTEKINTPQGPRTRVRAGPFGSKDDAVKAQARARAIGVNGPVAPASADAK